MGMISGGYNKLVQSALFASLTVVGAFIRIPLPPYPVPVTLQILFVFLAADFLGGAYGLLSQAIYLCLGLAGLPVFAAGGGVGYIFQPTFGYLIGFLPAAFVIGKLAERLKSRETSSKSFRCLVLYNSLGLCVIYLLGVSYLYIATNFFINKKLSLIQAVRIGSLIFIPKDLVLVILAAYVATRLKVLMPRKMNPS